MRSLLSRFSRLSRSSASSVLRSPLRHPSPPHPLFSLEHPIRESFPGDHLKWMSVGCRRGSKFATGFAPLQPKQLGSIIDLERAKNCSPEELVSVWDDYHIGRGHIGTSLKAKLYHLLDQRSITCRHFVIPLWRGSGYTNMFVQGHIFSVSYLCSFLLIYSFEATFIFFFFYYLYERNLYG
ncbi:ATP11 protein [Musa troglodytarum]|uniref:ATP11 protein n=1 Tax=Musa troglodytarum TaxID=320322 RepID=A0A9E7IJR8_9LILI|nr:ATP11 protein [Musa troglodytarum]